MWTRLLPTSDAAAVVIDAIVVSTEASGGSASLQFSSVYFLKFKVFFFVCFLGVSVLIFELGLFYGE